MPYERVEAVRANEVIAGLYVGIRSPRWESVGHLLCYLSANTGSTLLPRLRHILLDIQCIINNKADLTMFVTYYSTRG
jgi:hypothetical protein